MWSCSSAVHKGPWAWFLGVFTAVVGCQGSSERPQREELTVFAASSLTEAFEALEKSFERAHPSIDVHLVFAGSQVLRVQIEQGAPADVYAAASESHMRTLLQAGLARRARTFAKNELVVIVPPSNPAGIVTFLDLAKASRIVLGSDTVPVGTYSDALLQRAQQSLGPDFVSLVRSHVVSRENNVRLVRAKVELGEAEAALVYRTDAQSSGRVHSISIPPDLNVRATYPIAELSRSAHQTEAALFVQHVLSPSGQLALARAGFLTAGGDGE